MSGIFRFNAISFILLICLLAGASNLFAETPVTTLAQYFDLLESGNLESAQYLWTEYCQERSARFNIEYLDIPLKIDCSSPIIRDLKVMREHLQPPAKKVETLAPSNYTRLEYASVVGTELVEHNYFIYQQGDYYWLIYPQDYYGNLWLTKETKYFQIKYHNILQSYLNPIILDEADRFIEKIAKELQYTDEELKYIENNKIEYFYCESDQTVEKITGFLIKGTFDLASNDIISAFFPHYHEIMHLMINYKLKKLPLYTLPIMREGIAVYYGGRWGKTTSSLMALGGFLYNEGFVKIDSILTMKDFEKNASSDIAYPVAGLFTAYLLNDMPIENYLDIYRQLSGNFKTLNNMSIDEIKTVFITMTGKKSWDDIIAGFETYVKNWIDKEADIMPGEISGGDQLLKGDSFTFKAKKDWVSLDFNLKSSDSLAGNILFGYDHRLKDMQSSLFESQYNNTLKFEGYRYGVRFDKNEAGLYDYATNILLAKYIWGITPSDKYYNEDTGMLHIKFKKSVTNSVLPSGTDYMILPD